MSVPYFTGIKQSPITKIYYKFNAKKQLERFVPTRSKGEYWGWELSDYQDYEGNSFKWESTTPVVVEEFIKWMNPNKKKS